MDGITKQIESLVDRFLTFDQMAFEYCAKVGECDINDHLSLMEYSELASGYDRLCKEITKLLKAIKIKNNANVAGYVEEYGWPRAGVYGQRALKELVNELRF